MKSFKCDVCYSDLIEEAMGDRTIAWYCPKCKREFTLKGDPA